MARGYMMSTDHRHQHIISPKKATLWRKLLDYLGIILGGVCAVHCALTPILLTLLPLTQASEIWNEKYEKLLLISILIVASLSALISIYRLRNWTLALGFITSIIGVFLAHELLHTSLSWGTILSVLSGVLLIFCHLYSVRRAQTNSCCTH